jgi:hypothetical protein
MRFLYPSAVRWLLGGLGLLAAGCTDPYLPEAQQSPPSYLVVDGYLNAQGSTTIKLSRTYAVAAKTPPAEVRATVYIEDEAGVRVALREGVGGAYISPSQNLNVARRYRLHLYTLGGKEYASDFVPVKITPPIDNLGWRAENDGLHIVLDAHDATNNTRFYRWDYVETWEINPIFVPQVEYKAGTLNFPIISVPYPTKCWGTAPSTTVLLTNTTPLSQDVVNERELRLLPPNSERLNTKYSILVQQHAMTREEFGYWELLRKNTESIGSLFDPQPVQLTGNVHCLSTPAELVLGFVSAHSMVEKRLFVDRRDLPHLWLTPTGYESCYPADTVSLIKPPVKNALQHLASYFGPTGVLIPIAPVIDGGITAYTGKSLDCIDCRKRGSAVKPSFWP